MVGPHEKSQHGDRHAGNDDKFPQATLITNRRELEYSVSGLMGEQGRARYEVATDAEALAGFQLLSVTEGIVPALEPKNTTPGITVIGAAPPSGGDARHTIAPHRCASPDSSPS